MKQGTMKLEGVFWDFGSLYQRRCGVISYELSRQPYLSSMSLRRLRLRVAAQASRTSHSRWMLRGTVSRRVAAGVSRSWDLARGKAHSRESSLWCCGRNSSAPCYPRHTKRVICYSTYPAPDLHSVSVVHSFVRLSPHSTARASTLSV